MLSKWINQEKIKQMMEDLGKLQEVAEEGLLDTFRSKTKMWIKIKDLSAPKRILNLDNLSFAFVNYL